MILNVTDDEAAVCADLLLTCCAILQRIKTAATESSFCSLVQIARSRKLHATKKRHEQPTLCSEFWKV